MIKKILLYGFIGIVAIAVIGAMLDDDKPQASTPKQEQKADIKKETPSNTPEMTLDEFNKIQNGMTLEEVEKIVGGKGTLQSNQGDGKFKIEFYMWDGNAALSSANINLTGGKVSGKSQLGLK